MTYAINHNEQFNSIEVLFDSKPGEAVREALKALKFRWHKVRGVWYGYTDEQTARQAIEAAANGEQIEQTTAPAKNGKNAPKLAPLWDRCDVSALPAYGTDNEIKTAVREEARKNGASYDKAVAAYIRKHLRQRFPECKFSVTSGGAGYLNNVDIRVMSSPYVREFVKGNGDWNSPNQYDHHENSAELNAVLKYCEALHRSFDADDGDIYADYGAHHDLYGGASIDWDYKQTEATEEQKASAATFATRKAEHEAAEEARRAAEWAEREKQIERERAEAEAAEKIRTAQASEITEHVTIEDLTEAEQIAVVGLVEGYGKERNIDEVRETINEKREEGNDRRTDAVINRKVKFTNEQIYNNFCDMFLRDFDFLAGKGGTASVDVRLGEDMELYRLNSEQLESVKFYANDCVGIYLNDEFMFVINPEGFDYSRYVMMPDEDTDSYPAGDKLAEWRGISEQKKAFYIPAPVNEQLDGAELEEGEQITIISLDPWTMTASAKRGKLNSASPKQYAQHTDAVEIVYTPEGKRKPETVYIYNGKQALIYRGALPDAPNSLKYTDIGDNLQRVNFAGEGAKDFLIKCIEYYRQLGYTPIIDTIQR